jgi:polar amino acid transport system substrate-binding protein
MVVLLTLVVGSLISGSASAAGILDEIKKRGSVTVGTEAASYPFEFIQDGKIVGYNKELLDKIIEAWGVKLTQLDVPFSGLLTGLTQRKYDFIATNLFITPERAEKFAFTLPTAAVDMGMARRKGDSRVKSVDDLAGLVVGVVPPPSIVALAFNQHNEQLKAAARPKDIRAFQSSPEMFVALANKQIDVVVLHIPGILGAMRRLPDTFEQVGKFGSHYWTGWITRPEDTDLREALNVELRKLRDRGDFSRGQVKWFGYSMDVPDSGYLPAGAK